MFLIITLFFGIVVSLLTIILIRNQLKPRKISALNTMIKSGKIQPAIRTIKQLLLKDQANPELHFLLGLAYFKDNRPELALMELKKVNQIGFFTGIINEFKFREMIGSLFIEFNQPEEALKEYLLLIKHEPYNADYQLTTGSLFEQRGKNENAINYYNKAIEIDRRNSDAHFRLGKIYYNAKQLTQAKSSFEEAVKYEPENWNAFYFIGKINKDSRNFAAAITAFEKAQKDPELKVKSLIEKGICQMFNNKLEPAITELERAVRISTDKGVNEVLYARYFLAACYEKSRKIINAVEQWEAIYEKKKNFKDVAKKLSQYQEIRTDDSMKDYLIANTEQFINICKAVVEEMGMLERDSKPIKNGCRIIAVEKNTGKWKNIKVQSFMIGFYRVPEPIDESTVRVFQEEMKKNSITKGIMISSSNFTRNAAVFAENRPIDFVQKEKLQESLKNINISAIG